MKEKKRGLFFPGAAVMMCCAAFVFTGIVPAAAEKKTAVIAGAGPSTKVVASFVTFLGAHDAGASYTFEVPPKSIKHAGGIRSTEKNLFGRTGRPLNGEEKAGGVEELHLCKMPIAFVAGADAGVESLSLEQVCDIFTGKITKWADVGGGDKPITVITREPTEALFQTLKSDVPCMNEVVETKYVLKKDNQVVDMLEKTDEGKSAIAFGAARNFSSPLNVSGFESGVNVGLVYRSENSDHPLVKAAREVVQSEAWKAEVRKLGLGLP